MATTTQQGIPSANADYERREAVFEVFRRWGYLQATLDPLGQYLAPEPFPTQVPEGEVAAEARRVYCGTIGAEFRILERNSQNLFLALRSASPSPAKVCAGLHLPNIPCVYRVQVIK